MTSEYIKTIIDSLTPSYNVHMRFNGKDVFMFSMNGPIPRVGEAVFVDGSVCTVVDVTHREHIGYPGHSMIDVYVD